MKARTGIAILLMVPALSAAQAQIPVDDHGSVMGSFETAEAANPAGANSAPRLSALQLQQLVGPIALYPDDLLAIVLPAAAYPLQIVKAARFLDALVSDPSLKPAPDWADSIVALLNYPEVIELLNDDLDWTLRLGEAVVAQQTDVVAAVETFRDRAYAAGNLNSDEYQTVSRNDDVIYISPTQEDVIYVPYYEPTKVVYYQSAPVYHYYPRSYPVYYYPYAAGHHFNHGLFWGVTTAFTIGWASDSLHVHHHSYHGHPYYGRAYWNNWWYRRPTINVYNTTYVNHRRNTLNHRSYGDRWQPNASRRTYVRREGYSVNNQHRRYQIRRQQSQIRPSSFRQRDEQISSQQHRAIRNHQTRAPQPLMAHTRRDGIENRSGDVIVRSSSSRQHTQHSPTSQSQRHSVQTESRQQRDSRNWANGNPPRQQAGRDTTPPPPREQRHTAPPQSQSQPSRAQPSQAQRSQNPPRRSNRNTASQRHPNTQSRRDHKPR